MADTTPLSTNPTAPGLSTTEGRFTLAAQVVGFLLATFGALLTKYADANPGNAWAAALVTSMGAAIIIATHYGYVKGRAIVKNAMLQGAIDWAAPAVEAALEKALTKQLGPVVPTTLVTPSAPSFAPPKPPAISPLGTSPASTVPPK